MSPFDIGDTLAGRYKIKRFLGRGGMGEVFEVEDLVLHSPVALKIVHPKEADRAGAIERFKREINVARRVTHPNVCRLFDVGSHQSTDASGKTRETLFLTMELLDGENLSDRINRGRLTLEEALPILNGMAQGLGAAHRAGVLHRDFKAANVMLGVARDAGRVRAVVTDFGLARTLEREDGLASLSDSGVVVGTPAYMSPEQVRGENLTSASDIYAMGLVLYEMVTGQRPFSGGSAWSIAVRRLTQEPPNPRAVVADLDPRWEIAINACLQIEPEKRPKTPEEVVEMVKDGPPTDETRAIRSSPMAVSQAQARAGAESLTDWKSDRRVWAGVAGLVALLAIGLALSTRRSADVVTPTGAETTLAPVAAPAVKARPSLVVLGITNTVHDADADTLGIALSEMLTTGFSVDGKIRVLPSQEAVRAAEELNLGNAPMPPNQLARLRGLLGVDFVATGAATSLGAGEDRLVRLELSLVDLTTGKESAHSSTTGSGTALPDLAMRGSEALRKALRLAPIAADQAAQIEASWPSNPEASRLAADGLARFRASDFQGARMAFERAVRASPDHPVPHAGLAAALAALGYAAQAKEEAGRALGFTDKLSPESKLWMSGQLQEVGRDWKAASQAYATLLALAPDNIDYGVRLAESQNSGGMAKEALQTIDALRALPKPLSDDPRIDLAAARAFARLGDLKQQQALSSKAAQAAIRQNARLIAANSRLVQASAEEALGDRGAASRAAEEAQHLFEAAGDKSGSARALERVALGVYRGGDLDGARKLFERTLALHTETGDSLGMSRARLNLASIAYRQGEVARADRLDTEALAGFRQVGAKSEVASALNNIAIRLQNAGDLGGARKKYKEALDVFIEISDRRRVAITLGNLAEVMAARGNLKDSESMLNEGLATWRELGEQGEAAYVLTRLGDLAATRGDLIVAHDRLDEALRIQQGLKERLAIAETKVSIARLALVSEKPADAETTAREAEEVLRSEKAADSQILATIILAKAQLAQGKLAAARETAKPLGASAAQSRDANVLVAFTILTARLKAAGGDVSGALAALDRARLSAAKDNLLEHEFRIRLVAGEIEMKGGREKAGRTRLQTLSREAETAGFGFVARRSKELASR